MARLKVKYTEEVAPALFKKFGYKSTMQIPKIDKIVVSVGCGDCKDACKELVKHKINMVNPKGLRVI